MDLDRIIIEPILTEKSNTQRERHKYSFKVDPRANKIEIIKAVRKTFDVHPVKCNIVNVKRKPKRVRYQLGYTSAWKKAVITLPENESISIFEGA
jgi:large subunit ribosomal protein L23